MTASGPEAIWAVLHGVMVSAVTSSGRLTTVHGNRVLKRGDGMEETLPTGFRSNLQLQLGARNVELIRLDAVSPQFAFAFEKYKGRFLSVLSHSYTSYYGDDYHLRRLIDGRSVVYFVLVDDEVVAVSYVKRNHRRGVTAVYPETYRRLGLAKALVTTSLADFPEQYSIVGISNSSMMRLLLKLGFVRATSVDEVKCITRDEFQNLSDFAVSDGGIVFKRHSAKREADRETLALLYRSSHART